MDLKKITEEEMNAQGVIAAPDILNGTPAQNKAIFDRMVRTLVAPAVNACAEAVDEVNANQEEWSKQEQTRETNEEGRKTVEVRREEAEAARQQAEQERKTAEETRKTNESARVNAEQERQREYTAMTNAEFERAEAERLRKQAETSREENETKRTAAESTRNQTFAQMKNLVENLDAEAQTLDAETEATANVTVDPVTGGYRINFGIPKGKDGDGDMDTSVYDPTGKKTNIFKYVDNRTFCVTPQMFGAVGDNETDDTEAFKKCFEHTNIFIPAGKYIVRETIDVLPRTKVMGEGQYKSFITFASNVGFNVQEYASFSDMNIAGNNTNTAIVFPSQNLRLNNVRFRYLNVGVTSNETGVHFNTFVDCAFMSVNYPLYFPNAVVLNTMLVSNCSFNTYNIAVSALGTIYAVDFDRCTFEGNKVETVEPVSNCALDAGECASILFSTCYYENKGELVSSRLKRGNITISGTWIHEADNVVLSKESSSGLIVKFVDSTIINSKRGEENSGVLIDGTNLTVDLTNCMTKPVGLTVLRPITTEGMALESGVADNCTVNGGYLTSIPDEYAKKIDVPTKTSNLTNDSGFLTLDTLPVYNGEVE